MEKTDLIVDSNDNYQEDEGIFYIHPSYLSNMRVMKKEQFDTCVIKNSPLDMLTPLNLVHLRECLKKDSPIEIYVDQPLKVMQDYDAKQIEANAQLAGFENIEIAPTTYEDVNGKKQETLVIKGNKPAKAKEPNVEMSVKVTTTTTTSSNGGNAKTTTTTTTSTGRRRGKK
jgi:hypothetical protein